MLLGTETVAVLLFNCGYDLEGVTLRIRGVDLSGREVFARDYELEVLPRGEGGRVEVPSYELEAPACDIAVRLVGGRVVMAQ
jgi:hypothetical protein